MTSRTAKVFSNGRSQAVRLPAEFRFDTPEVYVRRDRLTGEVILTPKETPAGGWPDFFALRDGVPKEFLAQRPGNEPLTAPKLGRRRS